MGIELYGDAGGNYNFDEIAKREYPVQLDPERWVPRF